MEFLRNVGEQLSAVWNGASSAGRIVFVVTSLVCLALIIGVGIWSSQPEYVPLATNLSPGEAAEIKSKLDADGIGNELNYSGSAVLVAKGDFSRARLAVGDQLNPLVEPGDDQEDSIWSDPSTKQQRARRRLQQSLAHSIMQLSSVESARVHISQGDESPFAREQLPPKASVLLKLKRSGLIEDPAPSVVAIVVGGVEGLDPSNVRITDHLGRVLHDGSSKYSGELKGQLEYRQKLELERAARAEQMLAHALGSGKAVVRVTAEVDFTDLQRIEKVYDPEGKVKRTEKIETSDKTGGAQVGFGAAGAATNVTANAPAGQVAPLKDRTENIETNYELNETVDTVNKPGGEIKRLTVAAMVDLSGMDADQIADAQTKIEGIIKTAVGFDELRNDKIEVMVTKLALPSTPEEDPLTAVTWDRYNNIARNASLGIAALISLVLGLLLLRKMRPVPVTADDPEANAARARAYAEIVSISREDPETMARVILNWLGEDQTSRREENAATGTPDAAAA